MIKVSVPSYRFKNNSDYWFVWNNAKHNILGMWQISIDDKIFYIRCDESKIKYVEYSIYSEHMHAWVIHGLNFYNSAIQYLINRY